MSLVSASSSLRRRPLLGVAGAVAVAVLTVSGCSAGQNAQTVEQTSVVDGTGFEAGAVALRDVGLRAPSGASYAEGDTAYLEGFVVNQNSAEDQLVSVSSPLAGSVEIYADGVSAFLGTQPSSSASSTATGSSSSPSEGATPSEGASPTDGATPTVGATPTDGATATGSPSATGSSSAGATASTTTSGAAAPQPVTSVDLPTNTSIQFGYGNQQLAIVFRGLTRQIHPAETFQVTFTFAKAGAVTATIAVKLPVDSTLQAPTVNTEEQQGGGE